MKRILIASASILALGLGTPAFAQSGNNDSNVEQDGSAHEATVNQATGAAQVDILQFGTDQTAIVNQSADSGPAIALDGGDLGAGAYVEQRGASNTATIDQSGGYFERFFRSARDPALFNGELQLAEAIQNGELNNSDIDQVGDSNFVRTIQEGDGNIAQVRQEGGNTVTLSSQIGDLNLAVSTQNSTSFGGIALLDVRQIGLSNTANSRQDGTGDSPGLFTPFALVIQDGELNVSNLTQSGSDDSAFVNQIGDRNNSAVNQLAGGTSNEVDIDQNGDDGLSTVEQSGTDNFAQLIQDGTFNASYVTQGGAMNFSLVDQSGSGNIATVIQNAPAP